MALSIPKEFNTFWQNFGIFNQGLKSIGSMGALLPARVSLARKVDQI
jgi:hypothetical protein